MASYRGSTRAANRQGGFTLIELVMVVMILAILAAAAAPRYLDAVASFRVEAAAKRIAADLRHARRQAKASGVAQAVQFTVGTNSYNLPGKQDIDHPELPFVVNLGATEYPVTLTTAIFGGSFSTVNFDMHGSPDNGGTITVTSGAQSRTIIVDATTGQPAIL